MATDRARDAWVALAASVERLPAFFVPVAVFVASAAVLVSRRPDAFLRPQFYAEDGALWYARAWNIGPLGALFLPDAGYLQILSTGTAALATLVPMATAPLLFAIVAGFVEVSPAVFLATRRAAQLVPDLSVRLALGFAYLALPNTWSNSVVVTYESWRLALLVFMLLVTRPRTRSGHVFDGAVVVLCGLGSPLVLLMLPVVLVHALTRPADRTWTIPCVAAATSAIQVWHMAWSVGARPDTPLGAGVGAFCRIIVYQLVYGLAFGRDLFPDAVAAWPALGTRPVIAALAVGCIGLLAAALVRGPYALRLFVLYTGVTMAASLTSATVTGPTQWGTLSVPGAGARYFLFGLLALVASVLWLATLPSRAARTTGVVLLILMLAGGFRVDWRHPGLPDHQFANFAREFDAAPAGAVLEAPIEPAGWTMKLLKR